MFCSRLKNSTSFDSLKMGHGQDLLFTLPWKEAETSRKICKDLFLFWITPDFSRKIGVFSREELFFVFGGRRKKNWGCLFLFWEHLRLVSLVLGLKRSCPWLRECLLSRGRSLVLAVASDFFCVLGLGLEGCVLNFTSD